MSYRKTQRLVKRALELKKIIEETKKAYKELDEITDQLIDLDWESNSVAFLKDNFMEKNTAFKATGIRRFEIQEY